MPRRGVHGNRSVRRARNRFLDPSDLPIQNSPMSHILPRGPNTFMNGDDQSAGLHEFCREMLAGVSRTFALSIPELPLPVDSWVGCAYLVCRVIDTLEDRPGASERERQFMFGRLIELLGPPVDVDGARVCAAMYSAATVDDSCGQLMNRQDDVLRLLASFPPRVIEIIRECAVDMVEGLRRTPLPPRGDAPRILFETVHQLERYCHYAAGIVGIMLTRLFHHYWGNDVWPIDRRRLHMGKRFGRGLQITNIIKDHPADLLDGRCFIPRRVADACGCDAAMLLQPSLPLPVRRVIVRRAAAHLDVALEYSLSLPASPPGIRLFCIQPLMMALATLERVIVHPDPTPDDRPKITREQVTEIMATSREQVADHATLREWHGALRRRLDYALLA